MIEVVLYQKSETRYHYACAIFARQFITQQMITKVAILFIDGHSSDIGLEDAHFCLENKILLNCLMPTQT